MAQTIQVKRGTRAELSTYGTLKAGEMGFCTDTKEIYIGDGTSNSMVGRALSGPEASRPAAASVGRLYYVSSGSNSGYLYFDDGAAWRRVNAQKLTDLTGTVDDIADGTTYAKVLKADITAGHPNKVSDGTNTKTAAEIKTHIDDAAKHRLINDTGTAITDLWSAQKIKNEIELAKHNIEPQASVKDQNLSAPPASPVEGERYIIPAGATGVWAGKPIRLPSTSLLSGCIMFRLSAGRLMWMMSRKFTAGTGPPGCGRVEPCRPLLRGADSSAADKLMR